MIFISYGKVKAKSKVTYPKRIQGVLLSLLPIFSLPVMTSIGEFTPSGVSTPGEAMNVKEALYDPLLSDFWRRIDPLFTGRAGLSESYEVKMDRIKQVLKDFKTGLPSGEQDKLARLIYEESLRHQYDPELILAVIAAESSFYNWARSGRGAIGLMQIMPATGFSVAKAQKINWLGNVTLYDPFLNIKLGIKYLALMHDQFDDLEVALTAYNYGPTRVSQMLGNCDRLPKGYSQKVLSHYKKFLELESPQTISS